jgi:multidrug efflux pump subunit AcrA (membrane-fusion protein)
MNYLSIIIGTFMLLAAPSSVVYAAHDHGAHAVTQGKEDDHHEEESKEDFLGVSLGVSPKVQKLIGLKTESVAASAAGSTIAVLGRAVEDMEHTIEVAASQKGILKECPAVLGTAVNKGDVLCLMTDHSSKVIELKAPANGIVAAQFINAGEAVDTVSVVVMLADLSKLSAHVDVYEKDITYVRLGQKLRLYVSAYPDRVFDGVIVFVSPRVDESSLTVKVRVQIDNAELLIKPGMFLRGDILIEDKAVHLTVPSDAVQNVDGINVVFIQEDKETFTPVKVDMQLASRHQALIQGDLKEGDQVVSEGSFMLKSKILEEEIAGGCSH